MDSITATVVVDSRADIEVAILKVGHTWASKKVQGGPSAGENILPFKLIIIREKFLQKGLSGKFYKEKLENS